MTQPFKNKINKMLNNIRFVKYYIWIIKNEGFLTNSGLCFLTLT